jgi:hypothetical protein
MRHVSRLPAVMQTPGRAPRARFPRGACGGWFWGRFSSAKVCTHISHKMMPKAYRSAFWDSLPSLSSSGGMCVTCSGEHERCCQGSVRGRGQAAGGRALLTHPLLDKFHSKARHHRWHGVARTHACR